MVGETGFEPVKAEILSLVGVPISISHSPMMIFYYVIEKRISTSKILVDLVFEMNYYLRMIICSCNNISEDDLRKHTALPDQTVEEVYATMDKKPMCRQCLDYAEEVMRSWFNPNTSG